MTFCTFADCYAAEWLDWGLLAYGVILFNSGAAVGWIIARLLK